MPSFLVTGATGFIGQHLVARLLAEGHRVRASSRGPANLTGFLNLSGLDSATADLTDPRSFSGLCEGVEIVINLAGALGWWGVTRAQLDAVNVQGAVNLAREAMRAGVRNFVHVSGGGVSGPGPRGALMNEESPCHPQTDYEASKLAGEDALLELTREGLPLTIARATFTYGHGDRHKLPLFRTIARRRFILINGGRSRLHPVFIEDLLDGLLLVARSEPRARTFLLGGPRPLTTREIAVTIAAALDVKLPPLSLPSVLLEPVIAVAEAAGRLIRKQPPLTRSRLAQWRDDYAYDITRARAELGYNPRIDFAEGVALTVADYRERGWL